MLDIYYFYAHLLQAMQLAFQTLFSESNKLISLNFILR